MNYDRIHTLSDMALCESTGYGPYAEASEFETCPGCDEECPYQDFLVKIGNVYHYTELCASCRAFDELAAEELEGM